MRTTVRLAACVATLLMPRSMQAQMTLGEGREISFASAAQGRHVLARRDGFVDRMSPFDRSARLKTDKEVTQAAYLDFVGENVREWSDADQQALAAAFQRVQPTLVAMDLPFPERVLFVKTTGREEGGAAYTRGNAIVLTDADLHAPGATLQKTICHELFHVLSRSQADLREKLYAAIGFVKCDEVAFPAELASRKITNPDAPRNDHCIRVQVGASEHWAIPILFSRVEKYDPAGGGEFFRYLQFQLLLVERPDDGPTVQPILVGPRAKLVQVRQVSGFFEQAGKNTGYIIHPEEILADNFALLVLGERDVPSSDVLARIEAILRGR